MPIAADLYYHIYEGEERPGSPPVVLIHGAGGSHLYWPAEMRRLPGRAVYALDLPGHGKSPGRGQQSIAGYTQAVADWMEAVELPRAALVGHSMGSAIALSLALNDPEKVDKLILIGGGARLRVAPGLLESTGSQTTFGSAVETINANSFGPDAPPRLVELSIQRMGEVRPTVLHGDLLACDQFDQSDRLEEVQPLTLILCGSEDRMTPVRFSQFLADHISGARLIIFPGAGHMLMLERPAEVRQAVIEHLGF
jgi:pimeloyl-ACP methyl ester carboxylesterase